MAEHATLTTAWCTGELLVGGAAAGVLVKLVEPISFWGGVDEETGKIIDAHHPQCGIALAGTALLTSASRGSSSSTSTLLECIRRGTAPAMLMLTEPDPILVIAAVVAWEIYDRGPSVVLLPDVPEVPDVGAATFVRLHGDGRLYAEHSAKGVTP